MLNDALGFYESSIQALKQIDLSTIQESDVSFLKDYLNNVFNIYLVFQNDFHFNTAYRMTKVQDFNLENNKVRQVNYLKNTPLEILKKYGWYGRANTPNSTCLYLAETPQAALFECKPKEGDRIIITEWENIDSNPFAMYPINSVASINETVNEVTTSLHLKLENMNEYFSFVLKKLQEFIGEEFVKDVPITSENKYEYFYSAYFADKVLNSDYSVSTGATHLIKSKYDGILYPSIATKYKSSNLAIRESSITKLNPIFCSEYLIHKTHYDSEQDLLEDDLPFEGELLRTSKQIDKKIVWSDD